MADEIAVPSIVIGTPTQGVSVTVISRAHPHATDYWDGNWINTAITIRVGAFRGKVIAVLRSDELTAFRDQLLTLNKIREGTALFRTMEEWLTLDLSRNRHGHIAVAGSLRDQPGIGNTLNFCLQLDQTYLPDILSALDATLERFPVLGK